MFCPNCGNKLSDDSVFCPKCGARIGGGNRVNPEQQRPERPEPARQENGAPTGGKKGIPIWAIVVAAVVVVAIVVLVLVLPGKKGGKPEEPKADVAVETSQIIEEQAEAAKEEVKEEEPVQQEIPAEEPAEEPAAEDTLNPETVVTNLSTDENANAMDFEWFLDCETGDGTAAGVVITEPGRVERVTGTDNPLLNGGWRAYMTDTLTQPYDPEIERYFNVNIDTEGDIFNFTMKRAYMYLVKEGQTVEESDVDLFEGTWDAAAGTATAETKWAKVEFDNFYVAPDGSAEYATGTFYWISGEIERIALKRVMEQ